MPQLPKNAQLWLERAEIDYIGPFVKAWAAFNAWYRDASGHKRDADALKFVKASANPVRSSIKPLLQPPQKDLNGKPIPDSEDAQQFKLWLRDLHVGLDTYHIEVDRDGRLQRITFRAVSLGAGPTLPQKKETSHIEYRIERISKQWVSTVKSKTAGWSRSIAQDQYDSVTLQTDSEFIQLTQTQRSTLLGFYLSCDPRPLTDLMTGANEPIVAGDIHFRCTDDQLFSGLVDVVYAMRNALLHGEVHPTPQALAAYLLLRFLDSLK